MSKKFVATIRNLKTRKGRRRLGATLLEGERLIGEALRNGVELLGAVVRDGSPGPTIPGLQEALTGRPVVTVSVDLFDELSETEAPQGVIVAAVPDFGSAEELRSVEDRVAIFLDGIQDPGNSGSIVRTAAAFGIDSVILLDGSVDPFNPKFLRSTAGAAFAVRLVRCSAEELVAWCREDERRLYAADAEGSPLDGSALDERLAIGFGNEGAGFRRGVAEAATAISIKGATGFESLNVAVAAGIVMYEVMSV